MSDGESLDPDEIRRRYPDLGGFPQMSETTRRLLRKLAPDSPAWSPGRESKPEVDPKLLENSSGYFSADKNRVPAHWPGGDISSIEDLRYGMAVAATRHATTRALLMAATEELEETLGAYWSLIKGSEDQSVKDVGAVGYQILEDLKARVGDLTESISRIEDYIDKL